MAYNGTKKGDLLRNNIFQGGKLVVRGGHCPGLALDTWLLSGVYSFGIALEIYE